MTWSARVRAPLLAIAWPIGLWLWLCLAFGREGFNPTDQGYVLAQAHRIARGEVPHRDIISPRPLGSAVLHLVDAVMPGPALEVSAFLSLGVYVLIAVLVGVLLFERPPTGWHPLQAGGVAAAALIDLHTFPVMEWQTCDGLLLSCAGLVAVRSGGGSQRRRWWLAGFALIGWAILCKQSFFLAPVAGVAMLLQSRWQRPPRHHLADLPLAAAATAAPLLLYATVVTALGGLGPMRTQLLNAQRPDYTAELITAFTPLRGGYRDPFLLVLVGGAALRLLDRRGADVTALAGLLVRTVLTALVMWVALGDHLSFYGHWGTVLLWLAVTLLLTRLEHIDTAGWSVVALAYMSMLSVGYGFPDLMGGALALLLVSRLWRGMRLPSRGRRIAAMAIVSGGTLACAAGVPVAADARAHAIYREQPLDRLSVSLGSVASGFGDIHVDSTTAEYIEQVASCIRAHPASQVAIVPDNPGLYPAFGLDDPLPLDWLYPAEFAGSADQVLAAARGLSERGDYLVMFQTVGADGIAFLPALPIARVDGPVPGYLVEQLLESLNGRRSVCGSFVAVYSPAATRPASATRDR